MHLSAVQKKTLLDSAKLVYSSYLALDLFQHHDLAASNQPIPVEQTERRPLAQHILAIANSISSYPATVPFYIAGQPYQLTINKTRIGQYEVQLASTTPTPFLYKLPSQYNDIEIGALCANKRFTLCQDHHQRYHVSLALTPHHTIGGKGKIDLYRTHLLTLFNIIQKIENEGDISNLLVALATGSGKTFVQALWLAVLSLAGFTGIFTLPDRLIPQFMRDIRRLLPETMTQHIGTIRDDSSAEHSTQVLTQAAQPGTQILASSKCILDRHYRDLSALSSEQTCLMYDEQHLLMANERRRLRLLTLSQQFLSMFLTATPDKNTYKKSGAKPVAIMSSGQKQKSGQGQFPKLCPIQAKSVADLHREKETHGIKEYLGKMVEKCLLLFNEAIQPECTSTIHTLFDELPYLSERKENEADLRWRLQVPIAKKMLCVIEDNETLVNCCDYLSRSKDEFAGYLYNQDRHKHRVYHNGNFVVREGISTFFGIPDVDQTTLRDHWDEKKRAYIASFTPEEQAYVGPIVNRSLHQQLQLNMYHYLVEYVLSDISGLSTIEQNALRKRSPEAFLTLIQNRFQKRSAQYYYNKLNQEIDTEGALIISELLRDCSTGLETVLHHGQQHEQLRWTDNWFLDDVFRVEQIPSIATNESNYPYLNLNFYYRFARYVRRNILMGVFSGMEEEETPIADSKPFAGLNEERYPLYRGGVQSQQAKKRKRTSLELLDDTTLESSFTPNYLNITETQADNYFRLGFMGIYASNKKSEGFSDPDLHTILNPVQNSHDANNHPKKQIQIIGRDRGLDDTQFGHYIPSFGRNFSSSFDLNHLLKDDYYPELFDAEKVFDRKSIPVLGELVGKEIIAWYHKHQDDDESIDPEALQRHVLRTVAKVLRKLNIQNTHNIGISRAQLPQVISYAMRKLDQEIQHTKRAYQLSLFVRILGSILNAICECYFFFIGWQTRTNLRQYAADLANAPTPLDETRRADQIYLKIIQHSNFKDLIAQNLAAGELKAWLIRKTTIAQKIIEKNARAYLKPEVSTNIEAHLAEAVFPLMAKMLVPAQQALLLEKIRTYPGMLTLLQKNGALLAELQTAPSDEAFAQKLLAFLHQIPGLEILQAADVVNYPARVRAHAQWIQERSPANLHLEPELQEKTIQEWSLFLAQPEFVHMLDGLMVASDQAHIAQAMQDPVRVRAFVTEWLASQQIPQQAVPNPAQAEDETPFLQKFLTHFDLESIKLLPDRVKEIQDSITDYQAFTIATQIHQAILPLLVNVYPSQHHQALLASVSVEAIQTLLQTRETELQALLQTNDPAAIAHFIFTYASNRAVPTPLDAPQATQAIGSFLQKQAIARDGYLTGWYNTFTSTVTGNTDYFTTYITQQQTILTQLMQGQMTTCQTVTQKEKVIHLLRKQCIPVLAQCMLPAARPKFLAYVEQLSDEKLCELYPNLFTTLASASNIQDNIAPLLDIIAPGIIQANELIDAKAYAEECVSHLQRTMIEKGKLALLLSDTFQTKLADLFHPQDAQIVRNCLNDRQQAATIAALNLDDEEAPEANNDAAPFIHTLMARIREAVPVLANTRLLSERIDKFTEDMDTYDGQRPLELLDNSKLADTIFEQIQPIVQHPHFKRLLQLYIGNLTQDDLQFLLTACGLEPETAQTTAARITRFNEVIMQENVTAFKQEFLICEPERNVEFENYRFSIVLDDIVTLVDNIMDIHGYYRQHDAKGRQSEGGHCVLSPMLSETAKSIRIPAYYSFMSYFSRKIFFIQGTRLGLPLASQVFADAHQKTLRVLEYIHHHLLRPLWWSVNNWSFIIPIVAMFKAAFVALQNWLYHHMHTLVSLYRHYFIQPSAEYESQYTLSTHFDENAFAVGKTINGLTPLTSPQVAEPDCPKDVITHVEHHITRLTPSNLRIFAPPRAVPEVIPSPIPVMGG